MTRIKVMTKHVSIFIWILLNLHTPMGVYIIIYFKFRGLLTTNLVSKSTWENIGKLSLHICLFSIEIIKIHTLYI